MAALRLEGLDPGLRNITRVLLALGRRITSAGRTVAENELVGGSPRSFHLHGLDRGSPSPYYEAFDVALDGEPLYVLADVIDAARRYEVPVRVILETDHLHVDLHPSPGLTVEVPPSRQGDRWVRVYRQ